MERKGITEELWLRCDTRPLDFANYALPRLGNRKIRLFAIACCDLVGHKMVDERSRRAVEVARRHVEGMATDEDLSLANGEAYAAVISWTGKGSSVGANQASPEYGAACLAYNATKPLD